MANFPLSVLIFIVPTMTDLHSNKMSAIAFTHIRGSKRGYYNHGKAVASCSLLEVISPFASSNDAVSAINRMNNQLAVTSDDRSCSRWPTWRGSYINVAKVIDGSFVVQYPTGSSQCDRQLSNVVNHNSCKEFVGLAMFIIEPVEKCAGMVCHCNALPALNLGPVIAAVRQASCCFDTTSVTDEAGVEPTTIDCFATIKQNGSIRVYWTARKTAETYCNEKFIDTFGFLSNTDAFDSIVAARHLLNESKWMWNHIEYGQFTAKSNSHLVTSDRNNAESECLLNSVETSPNTSMLCQQLNFTSDDTFLFFIQRSAAPCKSADRCSPTTRDNKKTCCFEVDDYVYEDEYSVDDCIDPSGTIGKFESSAVPDTTSESSSVVGVTLKTTLITDGVEQVTIAGTTSSVADSGDLAQMNKTATSTETAIDNNRSIPTNTSDISQNRVQQVVSDKIFAQMTTLDPYYKFIPFIVSLTMIFPLCVVDCMFHRD